jgi:predicted MPP superfamily phosphohydrolase
MKPSFRLILFFSLFLFLFAGLGLYVYSNIFIAFSGFPASFQAFVPVVFWGVQLVFLCTGILVLLYSGSIARKRPELFKRVGTAFVVMYVPLLVLGILLMLEDVVRLGDACFQYLFHAGVFRLPARGILLSRINLGLGALLLGAIGYGITRGKYRFKVHKVELSFPDLPAAFDGFSITQISDIHAGSFDNPKEVIRAVEIVNAQKSDVLFFTGDLVNNAASEMDPWMDVFRETRAVSGKYSILGNHDYGDYIAWPSKADKEANMLKLFDVHEQIGFNLLRNENLRINRGDEFIELLGIENWGSGRFAKYGDMQKTLKGTGSGNFKILLSHDPSHWQEQVINNKDHVHLTLSGHTHGMQFGFELFGFRFSPVQFRYPRWAGLYEENSRYLYVNRGFGFLGFPGRVGIWPEITVITLKKGEGSHKDSGRRKESLKTPALK